MIISKGKTGRDKRDGRRRGVGNGERYLYVGREREHNREGEKHIAYSN